MDKTFEMNPCVSGALSALVYSVSIHYLPKRWREVWRQVAAFLAAVAFMVGVRLVLECFFWK